MASADNDAIKGTDQPSRRAAEHFRGPSRDVISVMLSDLAFLCHIFLFFMDVHLVATDRPVGRHLERMSNIYADPRNLRDFSEVLFMNSRG